MLWCVAQAMDEVWVPTVFNKHTFTTAGAGPELLPSAVLHAR
jgi:hypothetical protein